MLIKEVNMLNCALLMTKEYCSENIQEFITDKDIFIIHSSQTKQRYRAILLVPNIDMIFDFAYDGDTNTYSLETYDKTSVQIYTTNLM